MQDVLLSILVRWQRNQLVPVRCINCATLYVSLCLNIQYRALLNFADLYYISFRQDPWLLKTLVYLVYVIETVFSIVLTYDLGHSLFINDPTWTISSIIIPVGGGIGVYRAINYPQSIENVKWHF